jgi:alcohol dehydrogenase (cytochrome c)
VNRALLTLMLLANAAFGREPSSPLPDALEAGRKGFNIRCAACHGTDGLGGERAPAIGSGERSRLESDSAVRDLILHGIPNKGMPAFQLSGSELQSIVRFVRSRVVPLSETPVEGDMNRGAALFFGTAGCSRCHMIQGRGGLDGPDLTEVSRHLTLAEVETTLRHPNDRRLAGYEVASVQLKSGQSLRGFIRNESGFDLQLQGFDHQLHMLTAGDIASIRREPNSWMPPVHVTPAEERDLVACLAHAKELAALPAPSIEPLPGAVEWEHVMHPQPGDWPTYNGQLNGNRFSQLAGITPANISALAPKWIYHMAEGHALEVTPLVVDGVMYVTSVNQVDALDARTGRRIWGYGRPQSRKLVGDAGGGINRGAAILGDRVFLVTDNAHLLAIHRLTGALLWDVEMADAKAHYGSTSAPLIVRDLVVAGVSGGDEGIRGFLAAYKPSTGERVWRFWTIPARADPEASTWIGRALEHGCGATWLSGTYDASTDTLVWPVGNPCPDFDGDQRKGDNLYTDSVLALDPSSGKLKWYYQFTPHDLHDWDATETPLLVDAEYRGKMRKLLLQGNRNGFFYVLDREKGEFLSASPFVKKLTWSKGIGTDGRPILSDGWEPTVAGTEVCPSMDGATNWMSPAYSPSTGLFYLIALEKCNVFSKNGEWWRQGASFYGGSARAVVNERPKKYVRAIELQTGRIAWEYTQSGTGDGWGGLLCTASGLLFFGDDNGAFTAIDATDGKPLWHFQLNAHWHASPMTYMLDGHQYIAVAAGSNIVAFGLPQ